MPNTVTPIEFTFENLPIDFKTLLPENYPWAQRVSKEELIPDKATGYITEDLIGKIRFDVIDTAVINVGVGQGKTTAMYEIAAHYAEQEQYVVVVASPFKKLVRRDFQALKERKYEKHITVVSYENLETEAPANLIDAKIHVITINCLLGNPGEDNFEQKFVKQEYLKLLHEYCLQNNKKVVFLFDEIHASIENFNRKFIYNLRAWKGLTRKCFIASATFTEAANIVIEYISYLTDYKLKIFEAPRAKLPKRAKLHLYITEDKYSKSNLDQLEPMVRVIKEAIAAERKVHIVTPYKSFAEYLYDKRNPDKTGLIKLISTELKAKLLTSDTEEEFSELHSNIGTTFYTGISIIQENAVLIIILPYLEHRGIFSSGKVALVQTMARLRSESDIHVFMPKPQVIIEGQYLERLNTQLKVATSTDPFYSENQGLLLSTLFYESEKSKVRQYVEEGERELDSRGDSELHKAPINYPTKGEFILESSTDYLTKYYYSFGKDCSSLMLWAALNNQFANCTLHSLTYIEEEVYKIVLNEATLRQNLIEFYGDEIHNIVRGKVFYQAFYALKDALKSKKVLPDKVIPTRIKFIESNSSEELEIDDVQDLPKVVFKTIVEILYSLGHNGEQLEIDENRYVLMLMNNYKDYEYSDVDSFGVLSIIPASKALYGIYLQLIQIAETYGNAIPLEKLAENSSLLKQILDAGISIRQEDELLMDNTFSIFRFDKNPVYKKEIEKLWDELNRKRGAEPLAPERRIELARAIFKYVLKLFSASGHVEYKRKNTKRFIIQEFVEFPYPYWLPNSF